MSIALLIRSLNDYKNIHSEDAISTWAVIDWIEKHGDFAFVKENLEWHITGSMFIVNREMTKVLLMLHKKFGRWQQFGGHCDGETDVRSVAIREFHEESGVIDAIEVMPEIFHVAVHEVPLDAKGRPPHKHFDLLYLWIVSEDVALSHQESEVDGIAWFDLESALTVNDEDLMHRLIEKIHNFKTSLWND